MALAEGQWSIRNLVLGPGTVYRVQPETNPFVNTVRADHAGARPWRHGGWSGAEWLNEKVVPIRLFIETPNAVAWLAAHQALAAAFAPVEDTAADVEARFAFAGSEFVMFGRPRMVEPDNRLAVDGRGVARCAFVALDPLIYSGTELSAVLTPPVFAGGLAADGVSATTPPFGLVLNGSAGNYASTPDNAVLDIVGDIDLRADVTLANWASGVEQTLVAKYEATGNQRAYRFWVATAGGLRLTWSTNGTATLTANSTASPSPPASGRLALRVTMDVNDGGGNRVVNFYTAPTINGPWTQLGTTATTAGTTNIFASTATLNAGAHGTGSDPMTGTLHALEVRDGIDGTVVASGDFAAQPNATTTFVDYSGRTWTVQGAATINGQRMGGGLLVPFEVESVQTGGIASITNSGTADTAVNLRIDGPISQPTVSLIRPDGSTQQLRFLFDLLTGEYVTVDSKARTVFAQGLPTASRRGQVAGDFPVLPPGTSTLQLTAADAQTGTVTASWRSAWW